jgi:hypothetical protein
MCGESADALTTVKEAPVDFKNLPPDSKKTELG